MIKNTETTYGSVAKILHWLLFIMRLYAPDLEKFKSWTTPKAKKL